NSAEVLRFNCLPVSAIKQIALHSSRTKGTGRSKPKPSNRATTHSPLPIQGKTPIGSPAIVIAKTGGKQRQALKKNPMTRRHKI
ncbi:MAG: hypothetical protein IJ973_04845, partial [Christensenellaceae bacterium]|nr:hypothetical protein [Christensenellaceae bacterium]